MSCGYRHTALITTTGLLLTCGHGETGRLGHGDERSRHFPTVVEAFVGRAEGVVFVACGREHTVAVGESGDAFAWGWGEAGRLGIGECGKTLNPTKVRGPLPRLSHLH